MTYAKLIKTKRKELKISQKELAEFVGLTQAAISKIESGKMSVRAADFFQIAKKLKFTQKEMGSVK
jgi:transcriptional regulator with XRE-family HTH domain